jgi:hypothetical protein
MSKKNEQRSPRVQTSIAAVLVDSDRGELAVEVTDISRGGFRLRSTEQLIVGKTIRLRVPRYGDFQAKLRWADGSEAGGIFLEPVHL